MLISANCVDCNDCTRQLLLLLLLLAAVATARTFLCAVTCVSEDDDAVTAYGRRCRKEKAATAVHTHVEHTDAHAFCPLCTAHMDATVTRVVFPPSPSLCTLCVFII